MTMIQLILGALLLLSYSLSVIAQEPKRDPQDTIRRAMEMREQIHRRLMDHLFNGVAGSDDEIFKDMEALFEDVMSDMHGNFNDLKPKGRKNYDMAWTESKDGRTLLISPHDKNQRLELNVEKGMVSIKGKKEIKEGNSTSVSSFSDIFSVPGDCDWTKVKMLEKDGKILMTFPYRTSSVKQVKPDRTPVGPSKDDVTI